MPCVTFEGYQHGPDKDELNRLDKVESILCAVCTRLQALADLNPTKGRSIFDSALLNDINWLEAGVSKAWAENWWEQHRKKDEARRIKEREEAERKAKVDAAKAKLTEEELKLLGIK